MPPISSSFSQSSSYSYMIDAVFQCLDFFPKNLDFQKTFRFTEFRISMSNGSDRSCTFTFCLSAASFHKLWLLRPTIRLIESIIMISVTSYPTPKYQKWSLLLFVVGGNATISIQRQTIMRMLWIIISQLWISAASRDKSIYSSQLPLILSQWSPI